MKLGFIGAGNMGGAVIRGLIESGAAKAEDINVIRKNAEAAKKMADELGVKIYNDYKSFAEDSDVLFVAVKPNVFPTLLPEISGFLNAEKIIVSMAAGISTERVEELLGFKLPVIRIMPNVNASIRLSATAVCRNDAVSDKVYTDVKKLLEGIGLVTEVPENQFAIFTAIAGCSPAYVYMFIDALAKGAVKAGMNKQKALEIAAYAVYGSAALCGKSSEHPAKLCDNVCSPGGTTIEGVCTLDEYKFTAGVTAAVTNSIAKDAKLK
jgi:pyrroline-5-carboxylate reductase